MTSSRHLGLARNHDELIDLLRARKDELGLSNQFVDQVGGIAAGHCDQLLGPSAHKSLGRHSINALLGVLAVKIALVVDEEQLRVMEGKFEARITRNVHASSRISQRAMDRIKPIVLSEWSTAANAARNKLLTRKQRQEIARNAAKAKWRKFRKRRAKKARRVGNALGSKRRSIRVSGTDPAASQRAPEPRLARRQCAAPGAAIAPAPQPCPCPMA